MTWSVSPQFLCHLHPSLSSKVKPFIFLLYSFFFVKEKTEVNKDSKPFLGLLYIKKWVIITFSLIFHCMDSYRFIKSSSKQSTSSETDHHHHQFGSLIPRLGRKYRSLSFDSGLLLIVNQRFESPTRLVMATSALNSDKKIVTGPAGYVLEDVPHFSDYIPNPPVRYNSLNPKCWILIMRAGMINKVWNFYVLLCLLSDISKSITGQRCLLCC